MVILRQNTPNELHFSRHGPTELPAVLLRFTAADTGSTFLRLSSAEHCQGLRFPLDPVLLADLPPGSYTLDLWLQASFNTLDPGLADVAYLRNWPLQIRAD